MPINLHQLLAPPVITSHPTDMNATAGSYATFSVAATGSAPLTYQWQKDGVNLAGEVGSSLTLANVQGDNNGTYRAIVTNAHGTDTSNGATLEVRVPNVLDGFVSGLVAYYPFNGNANDESGNGNHGTVSGASLTYDRSGSTRSAYSFDGVDDWINSTVGLVSQKLHILSLVKSKDTTSLYEFIW